MDRRPRQNHRRCQTRAPSVRFDPLEVGEDLSSNTNSTAVLKDRASSPWSPFRHASFAVVWGATVISNIGGWMYSAASSWLMTDLNPDPFIVSMVQVATTLPMFLFALPAGALADIVDRRKFLIVAEVLYTTVAAIFAAIVWSGAATPDNLLLSTFLMGVGGALTAPVWQSIVPQLVPRQDLSPAVAANSVGINVSRAVGPALGGVMVARIGGCTILVQCRQQSCSRRCTPLVAPARKWSTPAGRAVWERHSHRFSTRKEQSASAGNTDPSRGLLFVRERLLGAPSASRAHPDRWWRRPIWLSPRSHRSRRS